MPSTPTVARFEDYLDSFGECPYQFLIDVYELHKTKKNLTAYTAFIFEFITLEVSLNDDGKEDRFEMASIVGEEEENLAWWIVLSNRNPGGVLLHNRTVSRHEMHFKSRLEFDRYLHNMQVDLQQAVNRMLILDPELFNRDVIREDDDQKITTKKYMKEEVTFTLR